MIEFAGYVFDDHKASIVCNHVLDGYPVMLFVHESDGDIQFLCGAADHAIEDAKVIGIIEILEHLRSIPNMPTVDPGFVAERLEPGGEWNVQRIEPEPTQTPR